MKVVVTFFCEDDGHLDAINPLTNKDKLIKKLERECENDGGDWLDGNELCLDDFKKAEGDDLLKLCEQLAGRGYFNVVEI